MPKWLSILLEFIRYSIGQITKIFAIGCFGITLGFSLIIISIFTLFYLIATGKFDPIPIIIRFFSN